MLREFASRNILAPKAKNIVSVGAPDPISTVDGLPKEFWVYQDTRGFDKAVAAGIERGKNSDWKGSDGPNAKQEIADFRALVAGSYAYMDMLSNVQPMAVSPSTAAFSDRDPSQFLDKNRYEFAVAPTRAWDILTKVTLQDNPYIMDELFDRYVTINGEDATQWVKQQGIPSVGTGGWWVVGLIGVIALALVAERTLVVIDSHLVRKDATDKIMRSVAAHVELNKQHIENEIKIGHPLPYSQMEIDSTNQLNGSVAAAEKAWSIHAERPLPQFFPDTNTLAKDALKSTVDLGTILTVGAVVLGGGLILSQLKNK